MELKKFGLLGKKLSHSYSKDYFIKKWRSQSEEQYSYELIEIPDESKLIEFLKTEDQFCGLNVTIPYKIIILKHLQALSKEAREIGAVNCIKYSNDQWIGHNTDGIAFLQSLEKILEMKKIDNSLILGSGGASLAVQWAIKQLGIQFDVISRKDKEWNYDHLETKWNPSWKLIINTTPLGMLPDIYSSPEIPYDKVDETYYAYDLVYNPEETLFLKKMSERGAQIKNGLEMLYAQADLSEQFWISGDTKL